MKELKYKKNNDVNRGFLLVSVFFILLNYSCKSEDSETKAQTPIEKSINKYKEENFISFKQKNLNGIVDSIISIKSIVRQLYPSNKVLWSDTTILNTTANNFLKIISQASNYGLDSSFYNYKELQRLKDTILKTPGNKNLLNKAEWEYSKACVSFFTHVKYGFINHDRYDSLYYQLKIDSLKGSDIHAIEQSIVKNEISSAIESLEPSFYEYKYLINSWKNFNQNKEFIINKIGVKSLKEDSLKSYENAKDALLLYGFLDTSVVKTDSGFMEVLKKFQLQHGLKEDGRIGSATAYALSRSNEDRRLSVMASVEKLKWKFIPSASLFYANIPAYSMKVVENNEVKEAYRTVVGKLANKTPEFNAKMSYLIINPFWHIPYSISSKEILPKLKRDSLHARKKGYRILDKNRKVVEPSKVNWSKVSEGTFNYKISQVRSGSTALGKVKFIFANKHSVYFHDTPSKRLFKNDIRAYSHGCVRLQNPINLASYILGKQDSVMTSDSVQNLTKSGRQKKFNVDYNIDVYLNYHSVEGTKEGEIKFYKDVYRKESRIKKTIKNVILENQNKMN